MTSEGILDVSGVLKQELDGNDEYQIVEGINTHAPVFVTVIEEGTLSGINVEVEAVGTGNVYQLKVKDEDIKNEILEHNYSLNVDFYVDKTSAKVSEFQIDAGNFAGYYYVEASTLFRRESDGVDLPAEITLPKVKIQSNFTFSMASTGDPSKQICLAA